jgi:CO dehydrogenase/acetyl-CoA synthase delta subunit
MENNPSMTILPMAKPVPEGAGDFHLPSAEQPFVLGTLQTPVGAVPMVGSELVWQDLRRHYLARWNIGRDNFMVEPGLYALGEPDSDSPVLVTANYKMSFDLLRQTLAGYHAWILVLDTKGINVWCAAGKGTFGTEELTDRLHASRLQDVVSHRRLIVPQLGATGVAAFEVKKYTGFSVSYGPVMVQDLPAFFENDCKATPEMRIKQFPFKERLVLVPVEIMQALKQGLPLIFILMLVAGFAGNGPFLQARIVHALAPALAVLTGIIAGTIVMPLLLPWIPGRAFSLKGALSGLVCFALLFTLSDVFSGEQSSLARISFLLIILAISSWYGMAFTGSSTYTSLNGVRKEMLRAMPLQFVSIIAGIGLWTASLWLG